MIDARLDRRQFIGSAGLLAAMLASPAWAKSLARTNAGEWAKVQALIDDYIANKKLPGAVAALARGTDDADFLVEGTIATDSARAIDADSLFRVYSMTKPITAMAAMMLIEDGKIGLDQDVGDFIPGFKNPRVAIDPEKSLDSRPAIRPVTIRNLMTHTGGVGYIINTKGTLLAEYARLGLSGGPVSRAALPGLPKVTSAPSLEEFGKRIATLPLIADPGTKWSYSAGLDIMGRVIEVASGMSFEKFLQTRMFDPLGMTSSYFTVPASEIPRLTTNYAVLPNMLYPVDPGATSAFSADIGFPSGGGGLVMSARDYDRFLLMLAGYGAVGRTRVMKEATAKLAMSNLMPATVTPENGFEKGQGFGAGGRVVTRAEPGKAGLGTYGWGGAANTIGWVDPTNRIRASGFVQYFNQNQANPAIKFPGDFAASVYSRA